MLLTRLIDLYSLIVLASVVVSWINVPRDHPAVLLLHRLTEPVLAPIRRALPTAGGIDFSPLVLIVGLQVLASLF